MSPQSPQLGLATRFVTGCPSAALLIERGGRLHTANPAARDLLGYRDGVALPIRDVLGVGWREIEVIAREGETELVAELPDLRTARVRLEPVPGEDGRTEAVVAFLDPVARPAVDARRSAQHKRGFDALFGIDEAIVTTRAAGTRFARTDLPILLLAETGTGKELLARAIHGASERAEKPFVAINCGALSPHLLESELFGYAPGAFTGAAREGAEGKICAARGGTLFLDEVAEMPAPLQALLLRVLEDGTYYRVGENRPRQIALLLAGGVLFGYPFLSLPPVRARSDVAGLIRHLLVELLRERGAPAEPRIASEALARMEALPWPGNVRQLKTTLRYALIVSDGEEIRSEHLPRDLLTTPFPPLPTAQVPVAESPPPSSPAPAPALPPRTLADLESERLVRAVEAARGNLTRAAAELGIARSTLYRRLRRHGLLP